MAYSVTRPYEFSRNRNGVEINIERLHQSRESALCLKNSGYYLWVVEADVNAETKECAFVCLGPG